MRSALAFRLRRVLAACGLHRLRYFWYGLKGQRIAKAKAAGDTEPCDLVVIVNEDYKGWILDGIAREVVRYYPGRAQVCYLPGPLPAAKHYLVVQHNFLPAYVKLYPELLASSFLVFYTHHFDPADRLVTDEEMRYLFARAKKVLCMNTAHKSDLVAMGLPETSVVVVFGGADPALFKPHHRDKGVIGFCSAYSPRKNPDLLLDIVKRLPDRQFLLLGRKWEKWERQAELLALPNLRCIEADYREYAAFYERMDVYVSTSAVEGGPIPLIETMMCNIVPVVSRVGFAPDLVRHGENGFMFDPDADADTVCALIRQAGNVRADVSAAVKDFTWVDFVNRIAACLGA